MNKCQVFTPDDYVEELLNNIAYGDNPVGKKLLENSCGNGNILSKVVTRYIKYCKTHNYNNSDIVKGLERDIYAFEIEKSTLNECIERLNSILKQEEIPDVKWNFYCDNYLFWSADSQFDYIVGNPPYITYSEIDPQERDAIKIKFETCTKGKFDYCYAFIEKSIKELSKEGKMAYLIPSSIFKTVFGDKLRDFMLQDLTGIYDYSDSVVFNNALVKASIILFDKTNKTDTIFYKRNNDIFQLAKSSLVNKWTFDTSSVNNQLRFGDYFQVLNCVATLCNDVFLLENVIEKENSYLCNGYEIEKDIVRPAASAKGLRYNKQSLIIYPYHYENDKLVRYSETEFQKCFPGATEYLKSHLQRLQKRKSDSTAKWFEYGRSQALEKLNQEKMLLSIVVSEKVQLYKIGKDVIPYAGMFIIPLQNKSLEDAKEILETQEFFDYAMSIGVHMSGSSVRLMTKDIMEYTFK